MVDLDEIKAMWKGFDGPLSAAYDEEAEEWVVTSADDGSPYTGVLARMECDYAEQLGTLWGGAGPQVAELVAEVERLRAIVDGRTTAPTLAEARAAKRAGCAFVRTPPGWDGRFAEIVTGLARLGSEREDQRKAPARWFVIDRDGRPCAWPKVKP